MFLSKALAICLQFEVTLVDRHLPSTVAEHDDLRRGLRIRVASFPKFKQHGQHDVILHREILVFYTVYRGGKYVKLPLSFLYLPPFCRGESGELL